MTEESPKPKLNTSERRRRARQLIEVEGKSPEEAAHILDVDRYLLYADRARGYPIRKRTVTDAIVDLEQLNTMGHEIRGEEMIDAILEGLDRKAKVDTILQIRSLIRHGRRRSPRL